MQFLRHVGKHGDRKVAVVFREVPGEPHMCLVTYTELLNQHIHDPMVQCIESDIGQSSENLADALNRTYTRDGRPILQVLHAEGQMKKVNTENIVMTPSPNVKIKLNELNKILDEMKQGEEAVKKLAELDKSHGLQDPADVARRMRGDKLPQQLQENRQMPVTTPASGVLGDDVIARKLFDQAQKMATEARGLLAESERLMKEASQLNPSLVPIPAQTPVVDVAKTVKRKSRTTKVKVTS